MATTCCAQEIVHEAPKNSYTKGDDPQDEGNVHTTRYHLVSVTAKFDSDEYWGGLSDMVEESQL